MSIDITHQVRDPEQTHDEVLKLEDEIMPVLTKVRDAINLANKYIPHQDEDAIERIEGLTYFKNECGFLMQWINRYMRYNEELRDSYIGDRTKRTVADNVSLENAWMDRSPQVEELRLKVANLGLSNASLKIKLDRSKKEADHLYNDLCSYYEKYNNITLKEWFRLRFVSKFKRSHN